MIANLGNEERRNSAELIAEKIQFMKNISDQKHIIIAGLIKEM